MTDRHAGYVVTLENDIREDDAQATMAALKQIKGVLTVEPVIGDVGLMIAQGRAENDVRTKVIDALWPKKQVNG